MEYPQLVSKVDIGQSYEGRPIYALKVKIGAKEVIVYLGTFVTGRQKADYFSEMAAYRCNFPY